jgi:pimeloyl-ACP methyl ester carboxylesterase
MPHLSSDADGATAREIVVLFHASGSSARQWSQLSALLQPRFRVAAVEVHGHGEQRMWRGRGPLTLADDAALALPLLRSEGSVHLVGHSYGGAVALKIATTWPELVASVAVYEPVLFRWLRDDPGDAPILAEIVGVADAIRSALARHDGRSAARGFIDYWSGTGAWDAMPATRQDAIAARMLSVLAHFDALLDEPLAPAALERLDMPALFMTGAVTKATTARLGALLRAALPTARHEVMPEMGHMGPLTHADRLNARIARFLRPSGEPGEPWRDRARLHTPPRASPATAP